MIFTVFDYLKIDNLSRINLKKVLMENMQKAGK
ncbi:MAG: hypothetical protein RLZZ198_393 [Bacteroidota bacterium]|jgi:hypothetical protein